MWLSASQRFRFEVGAANSPKKPFVREEARYRRSETLLIRVAFARPR